MLLRWIPAVALIAGAASDDVVAWRADEVPSPFDQQLACRLPRPGRLCDPDGVLTEGGRQRVADVLEAIRAAAAVECPDGERGFDVGAAVVRQMHPSQIGAGSKREAAERFAEELGRRWAVGDAGCENGVLLFLSIGDRVAYAKTAARSRSVLTDSRAARVFDSAKPLLREERYDDALLQIALEVHDALQDSPDDGSGGWITAAIVAVIVLCALRDQIALALVALLRCLLMPAARVLDSVAAARRRRELAPAETALQRVQKELERDEFDQTMCPICLEALGPPDVVSLDCRHRFHRPCVAPWIEQHVTCPLCRVDVQEPLSPEDEARPEEYQRRLRFYLSRVRQRFHRALPGGVPYSRGPDGRWFLVAGALHGEVGRDDEPSSYASSLQERYEAAMRNRRAAMAARGAAQAPACDGGGGGRFGGGGDGFSSDAGGGGGGAEW